MTQDERARMTLGLRRYLQSSGVTKRRAIDGIQALDVNPRPRKLLESWGHHMVLSIYANDLISSWQKAA